MFPDGNTRDKFNIRVKFRKLFLNIGALLLPTLPSSTFPSLGHKNCPFD